MMWLSKLKMIKINKLLRSLLWKDLMTDRKKRRKS